MTGSRYQKLGKIACCKRGIFLFCVAALFSGGGGLALGGAPFALTLPLIKNFSSEDLGTNAPIWCMREGTDGKLYAGSDRLLIFDGFAWEHALTEKTAEIRCIARQGNRVWIGGLNEVGYFEKRDGEWHYTSATQRLNTSIGGVVWSIFSSGKNLVFVTDRKVILLPSNEGAARVWELPTERRLTAQQLSDGILIGQQSSRGMKLWLLEKDTLEEYPQTSDMLSSRFFDFISEDADAWVYNAGGDIIQRNRKTGSERVLYSDEGDLKSFKKAMIVGGMQARAFTYVATYYQGLFVVDPEGRRVQVGRAQGLISDHCYAIAHSRADGVWVATDQGISFVHDFGMARFLPTAGAVRAIDGQTGDLTIGTTQGILSLRPDTTLEVATQTQVLAREGDTIFAGKLKTEILIKERASDFVPFFQAPGSEITNLLVSRKTPGVLFATNTRSVLRIDIPTRQKIGEVAVTDIPTKIAEDDEGNLWVSTMSGGVLVFDPQFQKARLHVSSKEPSYLALHEGHPLILRERNSILSADGNAIPDTTNLSRPVGTLQATGPAWVYGKVGDTPRLGIITRGPAGLRLEQRNVPDLRRLRVTWVLYTQGDKLLIGGETGVIEVSIPTLQPADLAAPEIEEIRTRVNRDKRNRVIKRPSFDAAEFELNNDEQEIAVKLKQRVWGLLETPLYESRLAPAEEEWTEHKYGEPIIRRNLPAGHYTLQIRTRHLGEMGGTSSLGFTRLPPWYASQSGITLLALFGTFAFYGAVKFRTRRIESKNRQLEEKIRERTDQLARANSAKSEFLASMSHEIRNPMNGVVGIIKMLQDSHLGAREKYLLTTLHRCAEQLRTTVDDVLDFSKIEAGEITLHPDTFDLAETVRSTIAAVDVGGEKLELSSWAGNRPIITGDQGKLTQILTNYLTNALKYGIPPRASVDVFVLDEGERRCRVTIAVRNPGPDLSPEELPKLFESFKRGEFAKVRRIGGNGLGLSICKRYAEAMGGSVAATSSGGITVFQLTIPFEKSEVRQQAVRPLMSPKLAARALAIEDEDYNRLVLGSILTKLGYKVDWAADGKTALQLVEQNGYDLILTDLLLPDTDGGTLTKKLLEVCEEPKPPVFAISAYSTKEKQEECLRAGMAGFISKPITLEKLEAAVHGWTAKKLATIAVDREVPSASISIQQLSKLGPIEFVIPDFARKIEQEWKSIELLLSTNPEQAANVAHKLVSATLLIDASILSDQLRLLEQQLRNQPVEQEIEKLREICREEVGSVIHSLHNLVKRRQRANEVRTPS